MFKRNIILSAIMLMVGALNMVAQPYCKVSTYTTRDGIPSNTIVSMARSSNGLMWFGTLNGLCCYDGHRFMNFRNAPKRYDEQAVNRQIMIKVDSRDNVWSITYERSVYMFDTRTCKFVDVGSIIKEKYGKDFKARAFYDGAEGSLWLASYDGGPNYKVDTRTFPDADGIEMVDMADGTALTNTVKKVECDAAGNEWIFTEEGIMRYGDKLVLKEQLEYMADLSGNILFASVDGKVFLHYDSELVPVEMPAGISNVQAIMVYDDGKILFSTNLGLVIYNSAGNTLDTMELPVKGNPVDMFADSKKRVWIYTDVAEIVLVDVEKRAASLMSVHGNNAGQTTSEYSLFNEDANGTVWMAPYKGIFCYYDEAQGILKAMPLVSDRESYGTLATINKCCVDNEKNIWFSSSRDIHHMQLKLSRFKFTDVHSNTEVRSLLVDSKGRTWAGTYHGVLAVYDADYRLLGYLDNDGKIQQQSTVFAQRIYSLKEDAKGRIWIGCKGNGLYVWESEGKMRNYRHNHADKYSLGYDEVYDMDVDEKGNVWLATFIGGLNLVRETAEGLRFINYRNELKGYKIEKFPKVRRVTHDGKGTVIVSTNNGLLTFSNDFTNPKDIKFYESRSEINDSTSLLANDVMQTLVMNSGEIYVLTLGGGVQRIKSDNIQQDGIQFASIPQLLSSESIIQSMAEDGKGNLWVMRESTIDRYDPSTGTLQQYGSGAIGEKTELSEALPVYNATADVNIAAARGGFVSFSPDDLQRNSYKPNIVFTGLLYQGEHQLQPLLNCNRIEVPADKRNLTVYFSALEYSDNDLIEYAYMLEGLDDDWNYVGAVNNASLSHLSAGNYRLLVKSTNSDGVEVDNVAELEIVVLPTFWETGWAKLIYFVIAVVLICIVLYVYNLHNRSKMERQLSEMKTKFFTDISHKLRTPLTLIGGPVAEVLKGGGLSDTARNHLEMVERNAGQMLELVNKMLKYSKEHNAYISDDKVPAEAIAAESQVEQSEDNAIVKDDAPTLLVVEDNDDLRSFLVSILSSEYRVLQAENGQRGLEIAEQEMPDFIITDVMMPVMDGLTMVKNIKKNNDICHIPIIVLSAKASMEDRIEGLKVGIDDYITKPFSATYLKLRVNNIIGQRRMIQQANVEQLVPDNAETYKLDAPQIVDADKEMMKKLMDFLEKRIDDTELKIEELAEAVNLGRSVFYGKIKSIVGMTPVDFVRHIRMQRAEELIANSSYSFSQIAYMVGFSDPKYFSKCFKKETGMTPSEYRNSHSPSEGVEIGD